MLFNGTKNVSEIVIDNVVVVFNGYNACDSGYSLAIVVGVEEDGIIVKDTTEFYCSDHPYKVVWSDHFNSWVVE